MGQELKGSAGVSIKGNWWLDMSFQLRFLISPIFLALCEKTKASLALVACLIFLHRPKHAADCHPSLLVPWSWFILLKGFRVAVWHTNHSSVWNVRSYPQETQCPLVLQFSVQGKSIVDSDFPFLYWLSILQMSKARRMLVCARVVNDWISLRVNGSCSIMFQFSHKDLVSFIPWEFKHEILILCQWRDTKQGVRVGGGLPWNA